MAEGSELSRMRGQVRIDLGTPWLSSSGVSGRALRWCVNTEAELKRTSELRGIVVKVVRHSG